MLKARGDIIDMKVVAMIGGLGSQMLKYAFYQHIKKGDECYIDTTSYRLQEMWNGYELERIFGIKEKDITFFFTEADIEDLRNKGINYKKAAELAIMGLDSDKTILSFFRGYCYPQENHKVLEFMALAFNKIKRKIQKNKIEDKYPFFYKSDTFSIYYDEFNHTSDKYFGKESRNKLCGVFRFPPFFDANNLKVADFMEKTESVAVHIRRSDHMYDNICLFENGYFEKAISYVKSKVRRPYFFLFSDEPDWCRENYRVLGLTENDNVKIIDWNVKTESFRDMQLMTYCQHNILAISSFGWWGYYLSRRKEKIVCAPEGYWLEVAVHF